MLGEQYGEPPKKFKNKNKKFNFFLKKNLKFNDVSANVTVSPTTLAKPDFLMEKSSQAWELYDNSQPFIRPIFFLIMFE